MLPWSWISIKKHFFERKLYCRPIIGRSPTKPANGKEKEPKLKDIKIVSKLLGNHPDHASETEETDIEDEKAARRKAFLKTPENEDFKLVTHKRKNVSPGKSAEKNTEKKKPKFVFKKINK